MICYHMRMPHKVILMPHSILAKNNKKLQKLLLFKDNSLIMAYIFHIFGNYR